METGLRAPGEGSPPFQLAINVWSAAELQEESSWTETVCENVSGLLVEKCFSGRMMMIRACLSLLIATVVKDLVTPQVFRHAV